MTLSITKHSYSVRHVQDLPRIVHEAFHIANTGRKGPVLPVPNVDNSILQI